MRYVEGRCSRRACGLRHSQAHYGHTNTSFTKSQSRSFYVLLGHVFGWDAVRRDGLSDTNDLNSYSSGSTPANLVLTVNSISALSPNSGTECATLAMKGTVSSRLPVAQPTRACAAVCEDRSAVSSSNGLDGDSINVDIFRVKRILHGIVLPDLDSVPQIVL